MKIILRYFDRYREIMGMKEMLLDQKDGQTFEDKGELKECVTVFMNGRSIEFLERLNTRLQDGDMISLFHLQMAVSLLEKFKETVSTFSGDV